MGNCIRKESSMQWAGEDWGSPVSEMSFSGDKSDNKLYEKVMEVEEEKVFSDKNGSLFPSSLSSSTPSTTTTEVKIKITKKQLEEILGKVDVQGLSVQQVLAQLLNGVDGYGQQHQRSWRPALQSIPEVN